MFSHLFFPLGFKLSILFRNETHIQYMKGIGIAHFFNLNILLVSSVWPNWYIPTILNGKQIVFYCCLTLEHWRCVPKYILGSYIATMCSPSPLAKWNMLQILGELDVRKTVLRWHWWHDYLVGGVCLRCLFYHRSTVPFTFLRKRIDPKPCWPPEYTCSLFLWA